MGIVILHIIQMNSDDTPGGLATGTLFVYRCGCVAGGGGPTTGATSDRLPQGGSAFDRTRPLLHLIGIRLSVVLRAFLHGLVKLVPITAHFCDSVGQQLGESLQEHKGKGVDFVRN